MPYVIVRQNHSIRDVLSKLAERTERTHSTLRGNAAVVVPMLHTLIMIASVDRHGRVALRSEIHGIPFIHLFDFSTSQNAATAFVFKHKKTIDVTDLSWPKQFVTTFNDPKPAGYAPPRTETMPLN